MVRTVVLARQCLPPGVAYAKADYGKPAVARHAHATCDNQPAARQLAERSDAAAVAEHTGHGAAVRSVGEQLERLPLASREHHDRSLYQCCTSSTCAAPWSATRTSASQQNWLLMNRHNHGAPGSHSERKQDDDKRSDFHGTPQAVNHEHERGGIFRRGGTSSGKSAEMREHTDRFERSV
jgi:hypothetical protein